MVREGGDELAVVAENPDRQLRRRDGVQMAALQQGGYSLASLGGHDQHGRLGQGEQCLPGTAGLVRNDDLGCRVESEGAELIMDGHHDRGRPVVGPGPSPWVLCQPVPGEASLLPQRRLLVRGDLAFIQQGG